MFYHMDRWHFVYHLYCCHLLAIRKNTAMNIHVQFSVWTYILSSLGYTPRRGITGWYGNSILNFFRNCQTVWQSDCIILQPIGSVNISLPTAPMACLFYSTHPSGCEAGSHVGLTCISQMMLNHFSRVAEEDLRWLLWNLCQIIHTFLSSQYRPLLIVFFSFSSRSSWFLVWPMPFYWNLDILVIMVWC